MAKRVQLEHEARLFAEATAQPPFLFTLGPLEGRAALDAMQARPLHKPPVEMEDLTVAGGPGGAVTLRILRPKGATTGLPVIVYIHGGGWVFGNAHTHDRLVRELAVGGDAAVVFPHYSLSPEAKYLTTVGLWDRVVIPATDGADGWIQVERGAQALQSVFFCPGAERAAYLAGQPADDMRFVDSFAHTLEHTGGYTPDEARRVAQTLLPDILPYDPTQAAVYPRNGRSLTDHATDTFLAVFTNGRAGGDNVRPHTDLLPDFPYLGAPHPQ